MCRVMKNLISIQSELIKRRCDEEIFNSGIKNLQHLRFLSRSLRCVSAADDQTGEQYSRQGRIKELKHFNKTIWSPKIL